MNDLTTSNGHAVGAVNQPNAFETYGAQASQKSIVGTLLKFSKGDYSFGSNGEEMDAGTQMIAHMDQLLVGWIRWQNSKPTDQLMGAVMEGFQVAKRKDLGDDDKSLWETDKDGKEIDPWSPANYLVLQQVGVPGDAGTFTFTTSSRGGLNAIGELCKTFGRASRTRPNEWPVITLGVDSYVHSDYGKIKVPEFEVVGWAAKENTGLDDGVVLDPKPADSSGRTPRGAGYADSPAAATKF